MSTVPEAAVHDVAPLDLNCCVPPRFKVTVVGEICCAFYEYGPRESGGDPMVDLVMAVSYDNGATFRGRMVLSHQPWNPATDAPLSREATRGALGWLALS